MNFDKDPLSCQQNTEIEFRDIDIINHKIEN